MTANTTGEELRDYIAREFYFGEQFQTHENSYTKLHPDSQREVDSLMNEVHKLINQQVLQALEKVKSNLLQLKELKENRDDKGVLWGSYDVVDVDDIKSAIEEIEKEYK